MGCRRPDSRARRASIPRPSTLPSARRRAGANAGPRPNPSPRRSSRQGRGLGNFWRWRDGVAPRRRVPAIGLADARKDGSFDAAGRPTGPAWAEIGFPAGLDDACYALKISGGSLAPLFRDGELLIVSPHAPARPGDRVAAKTLEGELLIAELKDQNERTLELKPLDGGASDRVLAREEIAWMSRIIWVSQ